MTVVETSNGDPVRERGCKPQGKISKGGGVGGYYF